MPFWSRHESPANDDLRIVVGLGNPGPKYAGSRHNLGAMAVTALAGRHGLRLRGSRQAADTARGTVAGVPVLLAVPQTFMNESGVAVARLLRFYKVEPARLIVVYDDIDLPFGTVRLRPDGTSGGNNGLKSIIAGIGTTQFPRLRLGVGRPPRGAIEHVLGRFPPEQERLVPRLLGVAGDAIESALKSGTLDAMNRYNRDWLPYLHDEGQEASG